MVRAMNDGVHVGVRQNMKGLSPRNGDPSHSIEGVGARVFRCGRMDVVVDRESLPENSRQNVELVVDL